MTGPDGSGPAAGPAAPEQPAYSAQSGQSGHHTVYAHPAVARALGRSPITGARIRGGAAADDPPERVTEPPGRRPENWRATERALRLATVALCAVVVAVLSGHAWALALAAGPILLLVCGFPGNTRPTRAAGRTSVPQRRCFEGEQISAQIDLYFDGTCGWVDPGVYPGPGVELVGIEQRGAQCLLVFTARRWGRWSLGEVDFDLYDVGGLVRRTLRVDLGDVDVYPQPADNKLTPIPVRLPDRLGEHTSRQVGEGIEFLGVRPYRFGDRQRRIHWAATTRRGSLQLSQFSAERATDAVVLVDAFADLIDPATGRSTLDGTVRAACGIARAYLGSHDRVGVVSIGGKLRWLQPGTGGNYLYRIMETILEVRRDLGYQVPDLNRIPAPALPHGAMVYVVSPLTDDRTIEILTDLSERGNPVVVVEIPTGEPRLRPDDGGLSAAALRLWRLDRQALRFSLIEQAMPVVTWNAEDGLDLAFAPLLRTGVQGRSR
ncbi:MAG TPA: DUF58 domain-containing protein [Actinocrinis sp.]|nr:DUF58 domain-containing protein [Actinocrinis sp.]